MTRSSIQRLRRISRRRTTKAVLGERFEERKREFLGTIVSKSRIEIDGGTFPATNVDDQKIGTRLKFINIGRPADAVFSPSDLGGTVLIKSSGGSNGGGGPPDPHVHLHSDLTGLLTGGGGDHDTWYPNIQTGKTPTILADWTFNTGVGKPPFSLHTNNRWQEVVGFKASAVDKQIGESDGSVSVSDPSLGHQTTNPAVGVNKGHTFVWTGQHTFNDFDVKMGVDLDFTSSNPSIKGGAGNLTITAGNRIRLVPEGGPDSAKVVMPTDVYIGSETYVARNTGWEVDNKGFADFRFIFANEMHVEVFVADENLVLQSLLTVSKSTGTLSADFTIPQAGNAAFFQVNDSVNIDGKIFQDDDVVMFYQAEWGASGDPLIIAAAYGVVTNYSAQAEDTQQWLFTRLSGFEGGTMVGGTIIETSGIVIDWGVDGDGIYEISAVTNVTEGGTPNDRTNYGPYARSLNWTGSPYSSELTSIQGQLRTATGVHEFGIWGGSIDAGDANLSNYFKASDKGIVLQNGSIDIYSKDNNNAVYRRISLQPDGSVKFGTDVDRDAFTGFLFSPGDIADDTTPTLRVGRPDSNLSWLPAEVVALPGGGNESRGNRLSIIGAGASGPEEKIYFEDTGDSYFSGLMNIAVAGEIRQGFGDVDLPRSDPGAFTGFRLRRTSYAQSAEDTIGTIGMYWNGLSQWESNDAGRMTVGNRWVYSYRDDLDWDYTGAPDGDGGPKPVAGYELSGMFGRRGLSLKSTEAFMWSFQTDYALWQSGTFYSLNDKVNFDSYDWNCEQAHLADDDNYPSLSNPTQWLQIGVAIPPLDKDGTGIEFWHDVGVSYPVGDVGFTDNHPIAKIMSFHYGQTDPAYPVNPPDSHGHHGSLRIIGPGEHWGPENLAVARLDKVFEPDGPPFFEIGIAPFLGGRFAQVREVETFQVSANNLVSLTAGGSELRLTDNLASLTGMNVLIEGYAPAQPAIPALEVRGLQKSEGDVRPTVSAAEGPAGGYNLGSSGLYWNTIYVRRIVGAQVIEGEGTWLTENIETPASLRITTTDHAVGQAVYIERDDGAAMDLYVAGRILVGTTVDGVDISSFQSTYIAHAADSDAHHSQEHSLNGTDHTGSLSNSRIDWLGMDWSVVPIPSHGELVGLNDNDHPFYARHASVESITGVWTFDTNTAPFVLAQSSKGRLVAGLYADEADNLNRVVQAGAGLTGGGQLIDDIQIDVGAGNGILVQQDTIKVNEAASFLWTNTHTFNRTGAPFVLGANSTGNLVTGLHADLLNKSILAGEGLVGGGVLTANRTLDVGSGDGVSVGSDSVAVDASVARDSWPLYAGNGLLGGGNLSPTGRSFDVGTGDGIGVSADAVNVDGSVARDSWLVNAGFGLLGGGPLSPAGPTFAIDEAASFIWTGNHTFEGNFKLAAHLIPSAPDTYDIGSVTFPWRQAYISQINAVIFAEFQGHVIGGLFIIPIRSGTLAEVQETDTSVDFRQNMYEGELVLIKAKDAQGVVKTEYMKILDSGVGPIQDVTRDFSAGNPVDPHWPEGTVFSVYGVEGDGRIELDATQSPQINVKIQGTGIDSTEVLRMGDLNGALDYSVPSFGQIGGNDIALTPNAGFSGFATDSNVGMRLFNTSIDLYTGSVQTVQILPTGDVKFGSNIATVPTTGFFFDSSESDLYIGNQDSTYLKWRNSDGKLFIYNGSDVVFRVDDDGSMRMGHVTGFGFNHPTTPLKGIAFDAAAGTFGLGNINIEMWNSGIQTGEWTSGGNLKLGTDVLVAATTSFEHVAGSGLVRFGPSTGANMLWNGSSLALTGASFIIGSVFEVDTSGNVKMGSNVGVAATTNFDFSPSGTLKLRDTDISIYDGSTLKFLIDATDGILIDGSDHSEQEETSLTWYITPATKTGLIARLSSYSFDTGSWWERAIRLHSKATLSGDLAAILLYAENFDASQYAFFKAYAYPTSSFFVMDVGEFQCKADLVVEGDGHFYGSGRKLGIGGVVAPAYNLDVDGDAHIVDDLTVDGDVSIAGLTRVGEVGTNSWNILDDTSASTGAPSTSGIFMIYPTANTQTLARREATAIVAYNTATPSCVILWQTAARVEATTGPVDGTDGTDGKVTVSAATNGNIYIENRLNLSIWEGILFIG